MKQYSVSFSAIGKGAKGENKYGFHLNLLRAIDIKVRVVLTCIKLAYCVVTTPTLVQIDFEQIHIRQQSRYRVLDRNVEFILSKADVEFWPRLLEETVKPAWLKVCNDKENLDYQIQNGFILRFIQVFTRVK